MKLTEAQERQKHLYKSVLGVDIDVIATKALAQHRLEKAVLFADSVENLLPLMRVNSGMQKGGWTLVLTNPEVVEIRKLGKE